MFTEAGVESAVFDCMTSPGGIATRIGDRMFRTLLAKPPVYDAFHFGHLRTGSRLSQRLDEASVRRLLPAVRDMVRRDQPRLMLSVFASGAGVSARIAKEDPTIRTAVYCTDAAAHGMWVHPGIDRYLVSDPVTAATVRHYDPYADIVTVPPPVRAEFYRAPSREAARSRLDLQAGSPVVLLLGGGWGLASMVQTAATLRERGYTLAVVAGSNTRLLARLRLLQSASSARRRLTALGMTDRMAELMAAADVVVTPAGQACHEARVVGRKLVVLDAVPGHGRENLMLELARGGALSCPPVAARVVRAVDAAVTDMAPIEEPRLRPVLSDWDSGLVEGLADLLG
jgi:UDP-N-acetylglucosamine:LPS N-acetylglucosamine transferase